MYKFDRNRIEDGWEKLCTNKQTNKQTDKPTDTTKIKVTWPWTKNTLIQTSFCKQHIWQFRIYQLKLDKFLRKRFIQELLSNEQLRQCLKLDGMSMLNGDMLSLRVHSTSLSDKCRPWDDLDLARSRSLELWNISVTSSLSSFSRSKSSNVVSRSQSSTGHSDSRELGEVGVAGSTVQTDTWHDSECMM